jgi:hypothetical protein
MVCVDLVGPFTIRTPSRTHSLLALTMIELETHHWLIQRRSSQSRNMDCSNPKQQNLTLYPWVMVCVYLVGLFTLRTSDKTHSLLALTMIDPASCPFFLHFLPPCIIFLHLWLFFAIGSIHQEAQAVKFNCSCTSGFT